MQMWIIIKSQRFWTQEQVTSKYRIELKKLTDWIQNDFVLLKVIIYCYPATNYLQNVSWKIDLLPETKSKFSKRGLVSAKTIAKFSWKCSSDLLNNNVFICLFDICFA